MPRADVQKLATGWAWNGDEAKKLGLVDQIGTYEDALRAAAKLGGIQGKYQTVTYDEPQFGSVLSALLGIERQLQDISAASALKPASLDAPALAK
jgi:protease-4